MANLNSVQTSQANPLLSAINAGPADGQENNIDQSVSTFPAELSAAKGKGQKTQSDDGQSDAQNSAPTDGNVQNLPIAGIVNPNIPANNAVPGPPAPAVTTSAAVVDSVVLAVATNKLDSTLAAVAGASPLLAGGASANPIAIASQATAQAGLAANIAAVASQTAASQGLVQVAASQIPAADSKEASVTITPLQQTAEQLAAQVEVVQNGAPLAAAVQNTTIQSVQVPKLAIVAAQQTQEEVQVAVTSNISAAQVSATVIASNQASEVSQLTQVGAQLKASPVSQAAPVATVAVPFTATASISGDQLVVKAVESSPAQANVPLTAAPVNPVLQQAALETNATQAAVSQPIVITPQTQISGLATFTPSVNDQAAVEQAPVVAAQPAQVVLADVSTAPEVAASQANISLSKDTESTDSNSASTPLQVPSVTSGLVNPALSNAAMNGVNQSEKSAAIQASTASEASKLTAVVSSANSERGMAIAKKELDKIDASNVGLIKTDAGQTSFAANLNQELKLSQGNIIKLEPHEASLSTGPLNAGVMQALKEGGGRVVMELSHPDQGTIQLDLRLDNQGKAYLTVEGASDSTRARLEQGSSQLKDQLASMGLSLTLDMRQQSENPGHFAMLKDAATNSNAKTGSAEEAAAVNPLLTRKTTVEGRINLYA